ncbi:hypothetical protein, partial [Delftia sp.]|uniref:hypothetical protein n=1 Tax=Delftia sp. TaxID=1886637 RepID=UPI00259CA49C
RACAGPAVAQPRRPRRLLLARPVRERGRAARPGGAEVPTLDSVFARMADGVRRWLATQA